MVTRLSHTTAERLIEILAAKAEEADLMGDTAERNACRAAGESLRRWLSDGGPVPAAVSDYAHLLDEAGATIPVDRAADESGATSSRTDAAVPANGDGLAALLAADDEDVEAAPLPAASEETAEEREFRRDLDRARVELRAAIDRGPGDLNLARKRIEQLQNEYPDAEEVGSLAAEATAAVNQAIAAARQHGDRLREAGQLDAARAQYDIVLQLDPEDRQADDARRQIDQAAAARVGAERYNALRRDLRETRDLKALERAVREAETLEDAGRLPPDMADLLHTARATFDDKRRLQGEMTTFARFGDLAARKKAVQDITRQMVDEGAQTIWDAGRSEFIPIGRALDEAQRFYVEESEKVARHELGIIDARLPAYPDAALKHLREVMARRDLQEGESGEQYVRHFAPDTVSQKLKPREGELEKMVDALRRAEAKVVDAAAAEDDLVALGLLLEARAIYPGMVDLEVTLEQARNSAIHRLSLLIEGFHNEARAFLDEEQFDEAVKAVNKADAVPERWPEGTPPEALQKLKDKGGSLRGDIQTRRTLRREFNQKAKRIRDDLLDPNQRGEIIALYNALMADSRFAPLATDREELRIFVNEHQDTGEQLNDLRRYVTDEDWQAAKELAERILKSGKAGDSAPEVQGHLDQADRELAIAALIAALEDKRVADARKELRTIYKATDEAGQEALRERLKEEFVTIKAAMDEKEMAPLFRWAESLAGQPRPQDQYMALRLYRHVANAHQMADEAADQAATRAAGMQWPWPPYALSLHAAEARDRANKLAESMRADLLKQIQTAAQRVRDKKVSDDDPAVVVAADNADLLRRAALLNNAAERLDADTLVIFQRRRDAVARERDGDWDGAVAIWAELDRDFPRQVARDLRRARITRAIRRADRLIAEGEVDQAADELQAAMNTPEIGESWELYLMLAEVLAKKGDFPSAFNRVHRVEKLPVPADEQEVMAKAVADKLKWLQREQKIVSAEKRASADLEDNRFKEALTVLTNALKEPDLKDSRRLKTLRDEVFRRGSEFLLDAYNTAEAGGSQENKTTAVVRLAELEELEKLADIDPDKRKAPALLEPLKAELDPSIRSTIAQAIDFDPAADRLDRSIEKAVDLSKRLQTFRRVAPALQVELGTLTTNLEREGPRISNIVDQLNRLRDLLRTVDDPEPKQTEAQDPQQEEARDPQQEEAHRLWDDAVVSGNFDRLETVRRQIRSIGLDNSPDAIAFQQRLDEWTEIRDTVMDRIGEIIRSYKSGALFPVPEGARPEPVEDFSEALRQLRQLRQMPATRRDNRSAWRQLSQGDYERILKKMGPLLVIADVYEGGELRGWQEVEEVATMRLREVRAWTDWEAAYTQHMNTAGARAREAESLLATAPRVQRKLAWEAVDEALQAAQAELANKVLLDGEPVTVRTRWAELIANRAEGARRAAEQWRAYAQSQLPGGALLHFPTSGEFDAAARTSREALEAKVAEAEQVGPSNEEERRRLEHFRDNVLRTMSSPQRRPNLRERLKNLGG